MSLFKNRGIVTMEDVFHKQNGEEMNAQMNQVNKLNGVFENKCVTMDMQKKFIYNRSSNHLSLMDIINNAELLEKFSVSEFPKLRVMSDGSIFFQPLQKIISPIYSHYVKWFSLADDFSFAHDCSFEYAKLRRPGYLMKIELQLQIGKISGYEVKYVTDVDNIEFVSVLAPKPTGGSIDDAYKSTIPVEQFSVTQFNPNYYMALGAVLQDTQYFIDNYLEDAKKEVQIDEE